MEKVIDQPLVKDVSMKTGEPVKPAIEKPVNQEVKNVKTDVKLETTSTPIKEEVKETKATIEDYSTKLASLQKKEANLAKKERELKEKEAKLTPLEKARQEKSLLKTFESMGMTFEEAMNRAIEEVGGEKKPNIEEKIKTLEQRLLEKEKAEEEAVKRAQTDAFIQKTIDEVKAKEEFELTNTLGNYNLVLDVMASYYDQYGTQLSADKAAVEVEKYLESEGMKLLQTKKFQAKIKEMFKDVVPQKDEPTLSNNMTSQSSTPSRAETKEQRLARAAALLKWT